MADTAEVKKGDYFIAGGNAKRFKVASVKDGTAVLEEQKDEPPAEQEPEEVVVTVNDLLDSEDWIPGGAPDDDEK